ncbi:MAG: hypothetical protein WCO09_04615 [bacterium]
MDISTSNRQLFPEKYTSVIVVETQVYFGIQEDISERRRWI